MASSSVPIRDLSVLLNILGITENKLGLLSEQEISDSLRLVGIVLPAEIVCVKEAWREQRQRFGVLLAYISRPVC